MNVGILGGTGPAGRGVAFRLAEAGIRVTVGSRVAERAAHIVAELEEKVPSVAAAVQAALPDSLVAAAFHHLPASEMENLDSGLEADVLVCSDHPAATTATVGLVEQVRGLRPLDAGSLNQAAAIESFTAVCITLNLRHKAHSTLRLAGI